MKKGKVDLSGSSNGEAGNLRNEIKSLKEEIQYLQSQVADSRQSREDFLSIMSHEIRTPLNAIVGLTHLIGEAYELKEAKVHADKLEKSVGNLIHLIDDVLDYNQIQAGNLEIQPSLFNIHESIKDLSAEFSKLAEKKKITFETELDPFLPIYIVGDRIRLEQVLNNLLSNAIKFTKAGKISLKIDFNPSTNEVKCCVRDSGVGIEDAAVKSIFERHAQLNLDRKYGGKGLGLSISKALVELMGGKLEVRSEVGKGSRFYFSVAIERASVKSNEHYFGFQDNAIAFPAGLHVLVVDDNEMNRIMLSQFLRKWGIQFDLASNGEEALEMVEEGNYDLILLDLQMPVMDGYEFTRRLRGLNERIRQTPIIGISADSISNVHENVTNAGMNDFLTKPFNPVELKNKIRILSHNFHQQH